VVTDLDSILHLLFEGTIFGVFSYHFLVVVRKYIRPHLIDLFQTEQKNLSDLIQKKNLSVSNRKTLEGEIAEQENRLVTLDEKMKTWQASLLKKEALRNKEAEKCIRNMLQKRDIQKIRLELATTQAYVIPQALKKAYEELVSAYKGKEGLKLLARVVEGLSKPKKNS